MLTMLTTVAAIATIITFGVQVQTWVQTRKHR